jgi:hypothetical protein
VALSAFDDPAQGPTPDELEPVLGPAARCWSDLIAEVRRHAGTIEETWRFSGPKYGWSMRLVEGKRVIVYLTPQAGQVLVGVSLGEKAIAAAEAAGLASARTLEIVAAAPRYPEGRGVRTPVATGDDLAVAIELARIKLGR